MMESRRTLVRTDFAAARRDLLADWRRWTAAEKSAALAALAVMPLAVLSGLLSG